MSELSEITASAEKRFAEIESSREDAIAMSRAIIRKTKNMIHAIHTGGEYGTLQKELEKDVAAMMSKLEKEPAILYSQTVTDAAAEYAEAMILSAVVEERTVPSFAALKISPGSWVLGFADAIGELRRLVLTYLMDGDVPKAERCFHRMEEMGAELMKFDVPDAIVPVRRKQDAARGIIEKTRSDVANAVTICRMKLQ